MTLGLNLGLGAPPPLVATPKVTDTKPVATDTKPVATQIKTKKDNT